ncbi:plexin-A2-like [Mytilus trossulus]|uniref:plexin-A2-like n=1 Tax=Mytilus trossulus TaxID=6551 RepID=UPI003003A7ED
MDKVLQKKKIINSKRQSKSLKRYLTSSKFDFNETVPILIGNLNSSNFTCEIGQNGSIVQNIQNVEVQWEMNSTNVSCTCIGVKLNESEISYGIRLKYSNMYFDNEVTLIVYTCDSFLNYDVCKNSYAIQRYECEWRNSKCCFIGSEPCCRNNGEFTITEISPISGPINGGTSINVFANYEGNSTDEIFLSIAEANCTGVIVKDKANSFICKTGKEIPQNDDKIKMSVGNCSSTIVNNTYFTYKDPGVIMNFNPRKGILAGNTIITITGKITTFEGPDRYNISFCDKDNITCISCSILNNLNLHDSKIMCKTGESSEPRNLTKLVVVIDTFTKLQLNGTFEYLLNPTFDISKNETLKAIESGGAEFEINGDGFNNVGQITVERVEEPCKVPSDKQAVCKTPEKLLNQTNVQTVIVNFDGIARAFEINYVADPSFERFSGVMNYDKESLITIKGKNILNGAGIGDYNIQVGLDGKCLISEGGISMTYINCFPPKNVPRTNKSEINSVHVIVEVGRIKVYIGDIQYQNDVQILSIIVGVLAAALVIAVTIGILAVMVLKKKKRKAIKEFKMELMTREEMVRKASREEFADAQMTMRSIKSDLFTSKVPFCDYKTYVLRQLFPNQDISTNPLLHGLKISDAKKDVTETAIDNFKTLLSSKLFLKSLVQTIDRPNMLTIQEKAHFSSVLSISLMGNMTLYFDLIECLMVDMIRSANKKQQKVLFRRFESITLRLMANWLQIGLYGQLTSNCGMQLFMLYKAVKTIVEMAPIDALTSNSKNTIAEEKLLKMRIEHQSFTLQIDLNGNSDKRYPVKVLDCDTISQVKQKCCAQIYKNSPSSKIPHNDELSLEWQEGRAGKLTLNDIDNTSERNNGMVCLNTLKHYMVKDNSRMVLMYKQRDSHTVNVNSIAFRDESLASEDITLLMPENVECSELEGQKWHLSNLPEGQSNKDVDFGDIFLNRLFLTKLLLSECIDTTFENLIDPQSSSIPIRYFIGMLDKLGKQFGVEQDVLQSWKNECYATRVWAPLIGKPGILFDVIVPAYVEPCMDILRQVFVESFTQTAHKINKESPSQKLLFHKDIPRYRKLIGPFFIRLEPVTDTEFWSEMDEISDKQKLELRFSRQSALQQLYNLYIKKYKTKIINDLEDMEEATDLQLANKLEDVIKIMDESSASR